MTFEEFIAKETESNNGYFCGIFSNMNTFFIADRSFNILVQIPAFDKYGNYSKKVLKLFTQYELSESEVHSYSNIHELKERKKTKYDLLMLAPKFHFPEFLKPKYELDIFIIKQKATLFAEWLRNNTVADDAPKLLFRPDMKRYTIEELYDLYVLTIKETESNKDE